MSSRAGTQSPGLGSREGRRENAIVESHRSGLHNSASCFLSCMNVAMQHHFRQPPEDPSVCLIILPSSYLQPSWGRACLNILQDKMYKMCQRTLASRTYTREQMFLAEGIRERWHFSWIPKDFSRWEMERKDSGVGQGTMWAKVLRWETLGMLIERWVPVLHTVYY